MIAGKRVYVHVQIYLYLCVLSECISVYHSVFGAFTDQKEISYPLKLELQMVMSHHVDLGNKTRSSDSQCS